MTVDISTLGVAVGATTVIVGLVIALLRQLQKMKQPAKPNPKPAPPSAEASADMVAERSGSFTIVEGDRAAAIDRVLQALDPANGNFVTQKEFRPVAKKLDRVADDVAQIKVNVAVLADRADRE
jgi:hypothetical protein